MKKHKWHIEESPDSLARLYTSLLPDLRKVARANGYALGVHGSMRRDLDLIAVPWAERYTSPATLVDRLCEAACGLRHEKYSWEDKPNGRKAVLIPIGMKAIIDLSICGAEKRV